MRRTLRPSPRSYTPRQLKTDNNDIEVSTETKAKTEGDMSDTTDSMNEDKYLAEATLCRLRARS